MRVLHILPMNKLSGAEKLVLEVCKNMKESEAIVVCGGSELEEIFLNNGVETYKIEFNKMNMFKACKKISLLVKRRKINIVHSHDNYASILSVISKKIYRLNIKIVSHIHSCYPWLVGKNSKKLIDSIVRRSYDHNILCGNIVYEFYKENSSYINDENTTIISNAIDINKISKYSKNNIQSIYEKHNIPKDKIIFGFVGRLCDIKGIIPFIKAVINRKEEFLNSKILLVGDGDQKEEIESLIKINKLEEIFILVGNQSNVYEFYQVIDILFLPSRYEGLPMVLLEAMAFKIPVISMNVGGIHEIIKDSYNGCLINKNDYSKFIDKLLILKENRELQLEYGVNGYQYVLENYDINKYVDKLIQVYYEVSFKKR